MQQMQQMMQQRAMGGAKQGKRPTQ
jgi:hypothetical protein